MATYLVLSLVALVVAFGVLVVAGSASGDTVAIRDFIRDLRNGVRDLRISLAARWGRQPADDVELDDEPDDEPEPVDLSLAALLRESAEEADGYLHVDDITETLARARDRAVKGLHGLARH
ncbi:MAG TPA: hypothetical protein VMV41_06485 [Cellulomonadaceae bacterium]|nr:hypothetical protein [Cellulomonadaceae bacterium]